MWILPLSFLSSVSVLPLSLRLPPHPGCLHPSPTFFQVPHLIFPSRLPLNTAILSSLYLFPQQICPLFSLLLCILSPSLICLLTSLICRRFLPYLHIFFFHVVIYSLLFSTPSGTSPSFTGLLFLFHPSAFLLTSFTLNPQYMSC